MRHGKQLRVCFDSAVEILHRFLRAGIETRSVHVQTSRNRALLERAIDLNVFCKLVRARSSRASLRSGVYTPKLWEFRMYPFSDAYTQR